MPRRGELNVTGNVQSGLESFVWACLKALPILLDRHGNVTDGRRRLAAGKNWPKIKLKHIKTEDERLIARLISDVCRRRVSAREKREILGKLGEIYLGEEVKPEKIGYKIAEMTGMSYRWVMKYLPDKLKKRHVLEGPF